jgi:hypothetical protein
VLFEKLEFFDHDAASVGIGAHALVADGDIDGLGRSGNRSRQQQRRCQKKDALEVQ